MGCYGAAILALGCGIEKPFSFDVADMEFVTREVVCPNCANHCEIICVYRDGELIDSWGNRCERGEIKQGQDQGGLKFTKFSLIKERLYFVSVANNRSLRKNTDVLNLHSDISNFLRHPKLAPRNLRGQYTGH